MLPEVQPLTVESERELRVQLEALASRLDETQPWTKRTEVCTTAFMILLGGLPDRWDVILWSVHPECTELLSGKAQACVTWDDADATVQGAVCLRGSDTQPDSPGLSLNCMQALLHLEALVKGGAASFDAFPDLLRSLKEPLATQLHDR